MPVDTAAAMAKRDAKREEAASAAAAAFDAALKAYAAGTGTLEEAAEWANRAHGAGNSKDPDKDTVERMKKLEAVAKQRATSGSGSPTEAHAARYHRARAESNVF